MDDAYATGGRIAPLWGRASGCWMRRLGLVALLAVSPPVLCDDWELIASDEVSAVYLGGRAATFEAGREVRFRVKLVYRKRRDMMGLFYDTATKDYVLACAAGLVVSMHHLLWEGDEIVWTFPPSTEKAKAEQELPPGVFRRVCG